jgi:hypothetical protein
MSKLIRTLKYSQHLINQDGPISPLPIIKRAKSPKRTRRNAFKLFMNLPYELQCFIIRFVSFDDLLTLQRTSRYLQHLCTENTVWRSAYQNHFNVSDEAIITYGSFIKDWQKHFKIQYRILAKSFVKVEKVECASKPKARFAHTASTRNDHIYYIGGQMNEDRSDEILDYNVTQNSFEKVTITNYDANRTITQTNISDDCRDFEGIEGKPPKFARHQSVIVDDKIYTFGGYDYTYFYNLSLFDISKRTWTYPKVSGDIPIPRSNHSSAVVGKKIYIFGGSVGDNVDKYTVTNDFYCLDLETMIWTQIESKNKPSQRVGHVMTAVGRHVYLFGGGVWGKSTGWTNQYNDLYCFDTLTGTWELMEMKNEDKPPVCTYPYIFTICNNICIFGGASITSSTVTNKLYMWDVLTRKWTEIIMDGAAISARSIGTANTVGNEVLLWGGYCGGLLAEDNDLYKLKLSLPAQTKCLGYS